MTRLTEESYWSEGYRRRASIVPVSIDGSLNFCNSRILGVLSVAGLEGKRILEIGGGGSSWLAFLASRFPSSSFVGLDYSKEGCDLLKQYADENGLKNLRYECADFFDCERLSGSFDLVYSLGVVEHFSDLSAALAHMRRFLDRDGVMVTVIPNMAGVIGSLTKLFNRQIYDLHVPYDEGDLTRGHVAAGMKIMSDGYLCSSNFGVLSSCFTEERGAKYFIYKWLTRASKLLWLLESRGMRLPETKWFSPYIYTVAKGA